MTRILLVRHCEAEGNHKRVFQGHTDAAVSENGRRSRIRRRSMPLPAILRPTCFFTFYRTNASASWLASSSS